MGVVQGSGAGLEIWAVVSTLLLDALRNNRYGALLTAPFS